VREHPQLVLYSFSRLGLMPKPAAWVQVPADTVEPLAIRRRQRKFAGGSQIRTERCGMRCDFPLPKVPEPAIIVPRPPKSS